MRRLDLTEDEAEALGYFLALHFDPAEWDAHECTSNWNVGKRLLLQGIKQQLAEAPSLGTGKERS